MKSILEQLITNNNLSPEQLDQIFTAMLKGDLNEAEISCILSSWRIHGESEKELLIGAKHLRKNASSFAIAEHIRPIGDNCGTGGDHSGSFNISTAAAVVAASTGFVKIAKHGNRSISSHCGSADLLQAAGLPMTLTPEQSIKLLESHNLCFIFAPSVHPVMKHVMPVRNNLKIRTIFNLLGPLANPTSPDYQLLGVSNKIYLDPMAKTLQKLGCKRSLVVHSDDGLDEISHCAPTRARLVSNKKIEAMIINPKEYGIAPGTKEDLSGGNAQDNLAILNDFLSGSQLGPYGSIILNAAALVWLSGHCKTLEQSITTCQDSVKNQETKKFFSAWIAEAKKLSEAAHD